MLPPKKIDQLAALLRARDFHRALKLAARFPDLGAQREAILTASSALLSPAFYSSLGKDPAQLVEAGVAALRERYPRLFPA